MVASQINADRQQPRDLDILSSDSAVMFVICLSLSFVLVFLFIVKAWVGNVF